MSTRPLILCADDEEDILSLVGLRLERAGYEVMKARDGEETVAAARARKPAVIVLDLMMPRLAGDEVLRALRADAGLRGVKVILLSARAQAADIARGLEAGADAYLAKPFKSSELIAAIEKLLAT